MRAELSERIRFLHRTITTAAVFLFISFIVGFCLHREGMTEGQLVTFCLGVPLVVDLLAYNYQSNQNSLESIARYIHLVVRPQVHEMAGQDILKWEEFFAAEKHPYRCESVLKVFPFVLPSLVPVSFLVLKTPMSTYQRALAWTDTVFLLIMLVTFRYKLRRVK